MAGTAAPLRIATRGSPLARWQAEWVAGRLRETRPGLRVELVEIRTRGDRDRSTPLAQLGGTGLFTREIQRAVLDDAADLAVHSLKDLPTERPAGLLLAAIPPREAAADVLVSPRHRTLDALPAGARVGTGSLRRRAQLLWLRRDLEVVSVRGNVESRLSKALNGELDAVVLAEAGLRRLGLEGAVSERLGPPRFLPAVGQGALGVECREQDMRTRGVLAALDDAETRAAVTSERRVMAELEAGCMIPLAAWGRVEGGTLRLDAVVLDPEGIERVATAIHGTPEQADDLGRSAAAELRAQGAERLLRRREA